MLRLMWKAFLIVAAVTLLIDMPDRIAHDTINFLDRIFSHGFAFLFVLAALKGD